VRAGLGRYRGPLAVIALLLAALAWLVITLLCAGVLFACGRLFFWRQAASPLFFLYFCVFPQGRLVWRETRCRVDRLVWSTARCGLWDSRATPTADGPQR
jgi:hypothetical protein